MNQQRQTIYRLRNRVLEGSEVHSMILDAVEQTAWNLFNQFCPEGVNPEEWDFESLAWEVLGSLRVKVSEEDLAAEGERAGDLLVKLLREAYDRKTELSVKKALDIRLPEPEFVTPDFDREAWLADRAELERRMIEGFRLYERERYLHAIDSHWKNHLYAMDHLNEGVHLEAYAQKDQQVIYKKEGF